MTLTSTTYWFYWKILVDCWLLFGESCQLHEGQGKIISSFSIDNMEVWKEDNTIEVFKVLVRLEWKTLDLQYQLEESVLSSGSVWCRIKSTIGFLLFIDFSFI